MKRQRRNLRRLRKKQRKKKPKLRIPTAKGTIVFKDKSKYDRKRDKKKVEQESL